MLSEVFWSLFITSIITFFLAIGRLFYKSKCKKIKCLCIDIERDIVSEEDIDVLNINKSNEERI